ncbi:hypothetical protein CAMSH0001_1504 [Campylobacter showae RM3277]|uniref:Uncharacterized protein n=1 Tax=Campylobacter showae RM3277 TaxID=553219 RepID=C6RCR8_9BACT|nr:hypothetical protein CAMSH0001_1504 [Campylobacter showae RM3277]
MSFLIDNKKNFVKYPQKTKWLFFLRSLNLKNSFSNLILLN